MTTMNPIVQETISLPIPSDKNKLAFILLNVFTPEECQQWIDLTEKQGYTPALVNVGTHCVLNTDFRNSDRCMIDDAVMAEKVFERIKSYLPSEWKKHYLVGLNERLRFLRYDPGQLFKAHYGIESD
jgi:hypothetical protein